MTGGLLGRTRGYGQIKEVSATAGLVRGNLYFVCQHFIFLRMNKAMGLS
jgi:uncharacterized membrane protein (UPF0136 family)